MQVIKYIKTFEINSISKKKSFLLRPKIKFRQIMNNLH